MGLLGDLKELTSRNQSSGAKPGANAGQLLLLFVCSALFCELSSGVLLGKAFLQTHLTQRRNQGAHPCRLT